MAMKHNQYRDTQKHMFAVYMEAIFKNMLFETHFKNAIVV